MLEVSEFDKSCWCGVGGERCWDDGEVDAVEDSW
jgi:hypothetical protein